MSAYTIALKEVHGMFGGEDVDTLNLSGLPIFAPDHLPVVASKIVQTNWNNEIAHETISMFRQAFRAKFRLILPTYNELYRSLDLDYDLLTDVDMTTIRDGTSESTSTSSNDSTDSSDTTSNNTSTSNSNAEARNFTYPQQEIGVNGAYATSGNASKSDSTSGADNKTESSSESSSTGSAESDGVTHDEAHQTGRGRPAAEMLRLFRENIINVDQMIVDEMSEMFLGTWTTGEELLSLTHTYRPYYRGWF